MRKFRDLLLAGTVVPALLAAQAGAALAGPPMLLAQNAPGEDHRPHPGGAPGGNHGGEEGRPEAPRPQAQPQRAPEPQRAPQVQQRQEAPRQEAPRQEPPRQEPPRQQPPRQEPPRQEPQQRAPEAPRPQVAPAPVQRAPEPTHQQPPAPQKRGGGDEDGQPRAAPAPAQRAPEGARPQPAPAPQNRTPDGDRPPQTPPVQRRDAVPAAPQAAPAVPHAPAPANAAPPPAAAPAPANRAPAGNGAPGAPNNAARPLGQPLPTPPAGAGAPAAAGAPNGQRQGEPEADKRGNHPAGQPLPNPPPGGDNDRPAARPPGAPNPGAAPGQPNNAQPNNAQPNNQNRPGNNQPGNGQPGNGQPGNAPGQPNNAPGQPNNGPGQPPQQQGRRGNNNGGAAAIGAAAGFVGGFLAAQGLNNINQVQQQRQEYQDNGTTIYREPGRTIIEGPDDNYFVAHDENERFRDLGYDLRTNRRGDEDVTIYRAPDGSEVTTVTDVNGRLLRRVRRFPDGRDVVIIDNGPAGPPRTVEQDIVVLPPPPLSIPQDRYVVDADDADEGLIYDTLTAPPVAPITRRYTLDQVRYSPDLRARMRSVDLTAITFDTGSWTVAPEQAGKLATIARAINQAISRNPKAVFLVEGFTDATGNAVDNLSLSDRRAQSVATLLTQQFQVPPENLTTQGYGAQYLKVQTQGSEVRNRRVVVQNIAPLLDGGAK